MLFNSLEFLFAFLPATLVFTWLSVRWGGKRAGIATLTAASVFFYGWWEAQALAVIGVSIAFNFSLAQLIAEAANKKTRKRILTGGVAINLLALGYFKYANFAISNFATLTGVQSPVLNIALPLAISFYTFQQIAFLVDTHRGEVGRIRLTNYLVSVVFFPHLIAGPLLHYRDIIRQFEERFALTSATFFTGLPVFAVGLAKKVAIADPLAQFVSPLFTKAQATPLEFIEAWAASLGYTAQLYFDFSGYSDMAIGLGLMFGIALPLNFFSPYKATSIIEFWRRWHMTLSSFLRDYLYIPLGGGRKGSVRRYINLTIVMLLGGLWHGAAWTFAFWGALHGLFLVINHLWRGIIGKRLGNGNVLDPIYGILTFLLVVIAWVFFRASTFEGALNVINGMFRPSLVALPSEIAYHFGASSFPEMAWGRGMSFADFVAFWTYAAAAYLLIFFTPNTAQIFGLDARGDAPKLGFGTKLFSCFAVVSMLFWLSGFGIFGAAPSEFLYFKF